MHNVRLSKIDAKKIERHTKGIANHWRILILFFLDKNKNATLDEIVQSLDVNLKTASGHTDRLVRAGLLNKKYIGKRVEHSLSPYGRIFTKFIKDFKRLP